MLTRYHRSAGTVLLNVTGDKIFLMHKVYRDWKEAWVLPKGHVESEESDEQTALRETREETGYCDGDIVTHLWDDVFEYDNDKWHNQKTVVRFLWKLKSDDKVALGLTEAEQGTVFEQVWLDPEEVLQKITYPWEKDAVQQALLFLQKDTIKVNE